MKVIFAYIVVLMMLTGCVGIIDHGFLIDRDIELYEDSFPLGVFVSDRVKKLDITKGSIDFWNKMLGVSGFSEWFVIVDDEFHSDISVDTGVLSGSKNGLVTIGLAGLTFIKSTGVILDCEITLSIDHAYDRYLMRECLKHELGHCLGLRDDPGNSIDLNSIMGDPLPYKGLLTEHDSMLLIRKRLNSVRRF